MNIPHYVPPYQAVRIHCNNCDVLIRTDTFITERVRNVRTLEQQGDYVFCERCAGQATDFAAKLNAFEAHMAAKMNEELAKSKLEYAKSLVGIHFPKDGDKPEKPAPKPAKQAAKRTPVPGEIPQPKSLNG